MAQKRTSNQSPLEKAWKLLDTLDKKTAQAVKPRLGGSWRDNLFEIVMTRLELAAKDRKILASVPSELGRHPAEIPRFAGRFFSTMKTILEMAEGPAKPHHVAGFAVLTLSLVDTFLKDGTKDLSKTMAALDRRLEWFERFADSTSCEA